MVEPTVDPLVWLGKHLEEADVDLLREMVRTFIQALMSAEADAVCGAPYGERSADRVNQRNGYRERRFDTRAGRIDLSLPKLRSGSYFPDWLIEPRRRAERALVQVVAECYVKGVSTRRVDGLIRTLGIEGISRSQVSTLAKSLDEAVEAFRSRPLDAGPYTYLWLDALEIRCREAGRVVSVAAVIATAVNRDGRREILGLDIHTTEDGAAWTQFLRGLVARGLSGVHLVISDDHLGLVAAVRPPSPGRPGSGAAPTSSGTCNPTSPSPPSPWWPPWSVRSSPSPPGKRCGRSSTGWFTSLRDGSPRPRRSWPMPPPTSRRSARSPPSTGGRSGPTTPRSA